MPLHDWTRVTSGTFHDFHSSWIIHLKEMFNDGHLPEGFYAQAEQHAGQVLTDVLTLQVSEIAFSETDGNVLTVTETQPKTARKLTASSEPRGLPRTLAIRHASGHRVVAMLEIVSPTNKDRPEHVQQFVQKAFSALSAGCRLLAIDPFPPGRHDPHGLCRAIWDVYKPDDNDWPGEKPLTLAAFVAQQPAVAYVEPVAVGDVLVDMPLFLDAYKYVDVLLEQTYEMAFRGVPNVWKNVLV